MLQYLNKNIRIRKPRRRGWAVTPDGRLETHLVFERQLRDYHIHPFPTFNHNIRNPRRVEVETSVKGLSVKMGGESWVGLFPIYPHLP